ncbi:hypothetical protein PC119_g116 [Phytophthora cactorum]|nr:hypothetical protein PC119_g116 [Phytophthora cactorum]
MKEVSSMLKNLAAVNLCSITSLALRGLQELQLQRLSLIPLPHDWQQHQADIGSAGGRFLAPDSVYCSAPLPLCVDLIDSVRLTHGVKLFSFFDGEISAARASKSTLKNTLWNIDSRNGEAPTPLLDAFSFAAAVATLFCRRGSVVLHLPLSISFYSTTPAARACEGTLLNLP